MHSSISPYELWKEFFLTFCIWTKIFWIKHWNIWKQFNLLFLVNKAKLWGCLGSNDTICLMIDFWDQEGWLQPLKFKFDLVSTKLLMKMSLIAICYLKNEMAMNEMLLIFNWVSSFTNGFVWFFFNKKNCIYRIWIHFDFENLLV